MAKMQTHKYTKSTLKVAELNTEQAMRGRAQHRAGYAWQASIQEHHTGSGASNSIISRLSRGLSRCTMSTQQLQNSKTAKCNSTARVSGFQPCYSKYTQLSTLSWSMIQYSLWSMYTPKTHTQLRLQKCYRKQGSSMELHLGLGLGLQGGPLFKLSRVA